MDIICYSCNNFGHIARNYRARFIGPRVKFEKISLATNKEKGNKTSKIEEKKTKKNPKKIWKEKEQGSCVIQSMIP